MARSCSPLIITGPARSGTTLLARMLDAHPQVSVASDPYLPLFRSFRNACLAKASLKENLKFFPDEPISDYYFTALRLRQMDTIQDADLNTPLNQEEWPDLLQRTVARANDESPDLIPFLDGIKGDTYHDLFTRAFQAISQAREKSQGSRVGIKEVWIIEFFLPLLKSFPDSKFVVLFRDPRAIIHSNFGLKEKNPEAAGHALSYARHWRKQYAFVAHYQRHPLFQNRLFTLRYEDLIAAPELWAKKICDFLALPDSPSMCNPEKHLDYSSGLPWAGNSSFQQIGGEITTRTAQRWRKDLDPRVIALTELVCGNEMASLGYERTFGELPHEQVLDYLLESEKIYSNWRSDLGDVQQDYGFELFRRCLLGAAPAIKDPEILRRSFLFEEVYEALRNGEGQTQR